MIFLVLALAFGAYYAGILIRFYGLPGPDPLPLKRQLLLGVPISIGVITPLSAILASAMAKADSDITSVLGLLGIAMEHGLVLNETFAQRLQKIVGKAAP